MVLDRQLGGWSAVRHTHWGCSVITQFSILFRLGTNGRFGWDHLHCQCLLFTSYIALEMCPIAGKPFPPLPYLDSGGKNRLASVECISQERQ